jgi:hypothetical protein
MRLPPKTTNGERRNLNAPVGLAVGQKAENRKFLNKNSEPARTGKSGRVALIGAGDRGGVSADRGCNSGLDGPFAY